MVVPVVCPLVLTLGRGGGAAWAVFSAGRSTTGLASCWRAGAAAGTLFDATALMAMAHPGLDRSLHGTLKQTTLFLLRIYFDGNATVLKKKAPHRGITM